MTDPYFNTSLAMALQTIDNSVKTLGQLGRGDEAQQIIGDAIRSYDDIIDDPSRSDAWKRQQSAARYIAVVTSAAGKLSAATNIADTKYADDKSRVFGIKGLQGDYASLQIALRDAVGRVNDMNPADSPARRQLLASAIDHGDETLSHALVESAIRNGDVDTTNDFAAAYPQLADATERLWDCTHPRVTTTGVIAGMLPATLKPTILAGLQDFEIERVAAGQAKAGRWSAT